MNLVFYNFFTAFVTISVLSFTVIYNTSFLPVVTLGGTVLGCALLGLCSALLCLFLRIFLRSRVWRYAAGVVGCSCILAGVLKLLPGWDMAPGPGTMLFIPVLCVCITVINEYIIKNA